MTHFTMNPNLKSFGNLDYMTPFKKVMFDNLTHLIFFSLQHLKIKLHLIELL